VQEFTDKNTAYLRSISTFYFLSVYFRVQAGYATMLKPVLGLGQYLGYQSLSKINAAGIARRR